MVLCIVAMVVFAILGIFSARYRSLAKEAFKCTFRMVTFRSCETNLEQRIRSKLTAKLMKPFPKIAKFTYKNFKILSWFFVILFFSSMFYSGYSLYNLFVHGSCNPGATCIFSPGQPPTENTCVITAEFAEFYGAECPHCKKMMPIVAQVENETGVIFQKIEVWHNETNKQTFFMHASAIEKDCGFLGVPTFYSKKTDRAICGEKTVEEFKEFIRKNG
jgi:thiol-disulfide isomerase/thioredoxin